MCVDPVTTVRMVNSVDCVVAVGHASGLVSIFQLPSVIPRTNNVVMIIAILILPVFSNNEICL